ncbi:DUF3658 domain-containing protein [Taibaiella koreensis]|uniref:DUF3658 domain-containing protein n=1 Tax=Taibaiella koreensis TaxID=1268548 RepID=UPI0013C35831|nr:DUF3658 domain-containing protein [Taibaiella koreensis]
MSVIHLIVGDLTATPVIEAIAQQTLEGEIVVLKDILHVGPLKTEGMTFSEGRGAFWTQTQPEGQSAAEVDDLERLMAVSSRLSNEPEAQIWFWMAPTPADVTAYYWLLHFLRKHQGRFSVININGLPFLDVNGKLFYPESIGHIPVKEIAKAKKLARVTTVSEWETDGDEWPRLIAENAGMRIHQGGKKLAPQTIDHYDILLLTFITGQNQKATKVVNQAMSKHKLPTGDLFLHWRLREMAAAGKIELNKGDVKLKEEQASAAEHTENDTTTG